MELNYVLIDGKTYTIEEAFAKGLVKIGGWNNNYENMTLNYDNDKGKFVNDDLGIELKSEKFGVITV